MSDPPTWRYSSNGNNSSTNNGGRCPKHNFPMDIPPPPTLTKGMFAWSILLLAVLDHGFGSNQVIQLPEDLRPVFGEKYLKLSN
jgi:hypothetical protein